jgi:NifB/MoaA-like Fe-S oxidoreductase
MVSLAEKIMSKINVKINVVKIINNFFGERITVSGLVTGKDIIDQMKNKKYKNIVLPRNMINDNYVMLDDLGIDDLKRELDAEVTVCEVDGNAIFDLIVK